ncbi:hypothetical protein K503DRAFT_806772 [Rhizopogon vinicolor AM-OR11-026]|uniref:Uncharacterized protein n=1 Tax=Rhizopogon vinicolor AM-OR11-026 TaxID=1314800 RepID=A0A1B7MDT5_9AGAM|nr:hypothetical protein K503DRAFT_806772 [Rhizopogon vinicolor AM-OR11-026]
MHFGWTYALNLSQKTKLSKKKGEDEEDEENASHYVGSGSENTNSDYEDERPKKESWQFVEQDDG